MKKLKMLRVENAQNKTITTNSSLWGNPFETKDIMPAVSFGLRTSKGSECFNNQTFVCS